MGPYSPDLRERVAAAVDHHEGSQREIACRFRVSLSFVSRLLQRRRHAETLDPKPHGGGPPPALGPEDRQRLDELIDAQPDATLEQLRQRGDFACSLTTLWRALRRRRLTRKKKSLHADERDRPDVQTKRRSFRMKVKRIEPHRLVFVDEAGVTTAMTPTYAWAPSGERAVDSAPGSWESVTVIAA
jgi:transposase